MIWLIYSLVTTIMLSSYRLWVGPTFHDRLMSVSIINSQLIVLVVVLSIMYGRSFYLDIALLYSILSFSELAVFLKFYKG